MGYPLGLLAFPNKPVTYVNENLKSLRDLKRIPCFSGLFGLYCLKLIRVFYPINGFISGKVFTWNKMLLEV